MCSGFGLFGWMGMGLGILTHLVFAALFVFATIWLFKKGFKNTNIICGNSNALEILNTRFAKGEITTEDYHRMKKELE